MVEKSNWIAWIAVIALIVAVISLVVVLNGGVTGEAVKRQINANSCNADDRCETGNLLSDSITAREINNLESVQSEEIYLMKDMAGNTKSYVCAERVYMDDGIYARKLVLSGTPCK